jgi:hypothetical protein
MANWHWQVAMGGGSTDSQGLAKVIRAEREAGAGATVAVAKAHTLVSLAQPNRNLHIRIHSQSRGDSLLSEA